MVVFCVRPSGRHVLRRRCFHTVNSRPPLVLVLDVDETLIRARVPSLHLNRKLAKVDMTVHIGEPTGASTTQPTSTLTGTSTVSPVRAEAERKIQAMREKMQAAREKPQNEPKSVSVSTSLCEVSLRPGVFRFFNWIRERRNAGAVEGPWIFSQGSDSYLSALMPGLDPNGDLFEDRVLSRQICKPLPKPLPWVLKDLCHVPLRGEANVSRVVLVDNNSLSAVLYPNNSLMVRDWLGDGRDDKELDRVAVVLDRVFERASEAGDSHYSEHLAGLTDRHAAFRRGLRSLHRRVLSEKVANLRSAKERDAKVVELWEDVCDVKRRLLGLAPDEH